MSNANKSSYKWLKARSTVKKRKKGEFNQRFNSTLQRLFPKQAPAKQEQKDYDKLISNLENSYNKKLAQQDRAAAQRIAESEANSNKQLRSLSQQVAEGNKKYEGLSKGVQEELNKLYAAQAQAQKAASEPQTEQSQEESQIQQPQGRQMPEYEYDTPTVITDENTEEAPEAEETNTTSTANTEEVAPVAEKVLKTSLAIDDTIDMGSGYTYRATNLYGPRTGANYVPGRKDGEHSRGVDLVSHDSITGAKVNLPIAIADGKVIKIWRQGSGKAIKTTQGKAGGYVMDVLSPNGKVITYAHLGPSVYENKDKMIGRQLKRGEVIVNDSRMSGSGTAPHIKVFMSDYKRGRIKRNYTDEGNDPTYLILNNSYL